VQALAAPGGVPLWVSEVLPGCGGSRRTHDRGKGRVASVAAVNRRRNGYIPGSGFAPHR
jgi:hypothetical protein